MKLVSKAFLANLIVATTLFVTAASAQADGWRWRTGFPLGTASASLEVYGRHFDDKVSAYASVTNARNSLYAGITSNLNTLIQPEFQKIEGFQSGSVAVKGPIQLNITPNGTQTPTVSLSTFAVVATVQAKKSFGPLSASCTVTVDTGSLNLSGVLDVVNGALSNLVISGFVPSSHSDCSSNISWIPVIGSLVDSLARNTVDGIVGKALSAAVGASHQMFDPVKFAGLNVAIPSKRYVVNEVGFDAGQYVVNNLAYLISSTPVSVRFAPPLPPLYAPSTNIDRSLNPRYIQLDEAFSIYFPSAPYGGIKFSVYDETLFNSYWECIPMKPRCGPPNTQ